MPNVPYSYEVNGKLVTGNGSLIPISSLSNRSLLPSSTVFWKTANLWFDHLSFQLHTRVLYPTRNSKGLSCNICTYIERHLAVGNLLHVRIVASVFSRSSDPSSFQISISLTVSYHCSALFTKFFALFLSKLCARCM